MPADMKAQIQMPVDNHEAEMARADLYKMAKYSMKLFQMIQEGQELEGWVQAKITRASDYISSIYHYMEYQMKFGGGLPAQNIEDITSEAEVMSGEEPVAEEDDEVNMKEGMSYEQRLQALLEGKVKKMTAKKEPAKKVKEIKKNKTSKKSKDVEEALDMNLLKAAQKDMAKRPPKKDAESDANARKPYGYRGASGSEGDDAPKKKSTKKVKEGNFEIDAKELKPAHDKGYADAAKGITKSPYNPGSPADKAYQEGQQAYKRHFG
jgi:hypothetical protein